MSAVVRCSSLVVFVSKFVFRILAPLPVTHKRRVTGIAFFFPSHIETLSVGRLKCQNAQRGLGPQRSRQKRNPPT